MNKYKKGDIVYFYPNFLISDNVDFGIIKYIYRTEDSYDIDLYIGPDDNIEDSWYLRTVKLNHNMLLGRLIENNEVMNNILINLNKLEKRIRKRS